MSKKCQDYIIQELMSAMVDAVNYQGLAKKIIDVFAKLFEAELCTLWRHVKQDGEDRLVLSASIGSQRKPGDVLPTYVLDWSATSNEQIRGVTAWIAIRKQTCLVNSFTELSNDITKPWYGTHQGSWDQYQFKGSANENFKNLLGLPIVYNGTDAVIGVLKIESTHKSAGFSLADQMLAERLIPFVAIALQTMVIREQHEQHRQHVIRDLTRALLHVDTTVFYQELVNKTAELLRADICSLWLVNEDSSKLRLSANIGVLGKGPGIPEYNLNWNTENDADIEGLTPYVIVRRKATFVEEYQDLRSYGAWRGKWDQSQWDGRVESEFGCLYAVPLLDIDNTPFGVLKIENRVGKHKFGAVDRATFDLMSDFIALAIEFNSRLRKDIVYDFFHLLKQPVSNAVMTFSELRRELTRSDPRPKRIEERLEMLARNLQTISIWNTNVYGLASARQENPDEMATEISVHDLLLAATKNMQLLFPDFSCNLDQADKGIILVLTPLQRKKVDAILFNVLSNSFKYSTEPRDIRATVQREKDSIQLVISDNGKGIAPEDLPRIFEPYFTRGEEEWPESLGLGLATVDRLLAEFNWVREVESELGKGTRFTITIS